MWSSFAAFRNGNEKRKRVLDIGTYGHQLKGQQSRIGNSFNDVERGVWRLP